MKFLSQPVEAAAGTCVLSDRCGSDERHAFVRRLFDDSVARFETPPVVEFTLRYPCLDGAEGLVAAKHLDIATQNRRWQRRGGLSGQ